MDLNVFHPTPSDFIRQKSYGMTHGTIFIPTCRIRHFVGSCTCHGHYCIIPTAYCTTRHDKTTSDKKIVMCGGLRHDKTKFGSCRRYLALLDHSRRGPIFVLSCRVVSLTPAHYTIFLSRVVASCCVMCGGHKCIIFDIKCPG